jgi:hypothetical protein
MKKRTFAIAAFAIAAFAGCLKNDIVDPARAGVLVDLLSPNATNTTIVLNSNTLGSNVSYGSGPTLYNQVSPGLGNLSIFASSTAQLLNYSFTTESGKYYSLFVVDSASRMKVIAARDSVNYPNTTDSVKVRFYNFAANSTQLSVVRVDSNATTTPMWTNRAFETQESANNFNSFMDLKAGTYRFQVIAPFSPTMPLKDTSITFEGKHIYTLFIKGFYPDTSGTTKVGLGIVRHG